MTPRIRHAAAAAALSLVAAVPLGGQATLLRLVPPEGQVSRYAVSMEVNLESPMMPTTDPVLTARAHQTTTVLDVEGETIRLRTVIDSAAMTSALPGAGQVPDLSGSVFTVDMDTRGRMLGGVGAQDAPDDTRLILESLLENSNYFALPESEVSPGDSWADDLTVNLSLGGVSSGTEVELTYTFVSLDGSLATIAFEGPVEANLDMGGMLMHVTGTMTGTATVDLAQGLYRSQESEMSLDTAAPGMAMVIKTKQTMTLVPN